MTAPAASSVQSGPLDACSLRPLGVDPLGTNFLGWDPVARRGFRCKRLCRQLFAGPEDWAGARSRLEKLSGLPIPGATAVLAVEAGMVVRFDVVDGVPLAELIRLRVAAGRRLSWTEVRLILEPLARVVDQLPTPHGLISPRSILMTSQGPVLEDFGLGASIWSRSLAIAYLGAGEPTGFLAPELWQPGYARHRATDLYGLAGLAADLALGTRVRVEIEAGRTKDAFSRVLAAGLRPRPEQRPRSAQAWFAELAGRAETLGFVDRASGAPGAFPAGGARVTAPR